MMLLLTLILIAPVALLIADAMSSRRRKRF